MRLHPIPFRRLERQVVPLAAVLAALLAVPAVVLAEAAAEKGLEIARKADATDQGFEDSVATLDMVLENAHGQSSTRKLEIKTLEVAAEDEGDKTFIVFHEPRDVAGTALVTHTHILEPDDQWLYLPALKRVKRISSANKSGPFVGSEFAYEDFSSQEVGKWEHAHLRTEPCPTDESLECEVIERRPKYENSGYTRQETWVDTKDWQYRKIDFYDRKDSLLKTLWLRDYQLHEDAYWRAHELFMENHQTQKKTTLGYSEYEFKQGLSEREFEQSALKRVR